MRVAVILFVVVSVGLPSQAFSQHAQVPKMYRLVAQEHRVPSKLFYALILNESRSVSTQDKQSKILPWPWTVNHRGKAHFFPSRVTAYQYATHLIEQNDEHFDIGLGQMNWRWHKHRFKDVWSALDPYTNLSASAEHFREQYERPECNQWELAVGCYHRPAQKEKDKEIAKQYAGRVLSLWASI